jgi:hypothetical protein
MSITSTDLSDGLLSAAVLMRRYGICNRTLARWLKGEAAHPRYAGLNFPKPIMINKRRYWHRQNLEAWERARGCGGVIVLDVMLFAVVVGAVTLALAVDAAALIAWLRR